MNNVKKKIEGYISKNNIKKAIKELVKIEIDNSDLNCLKWRADLYYSLREYTYALNDFNRILKVEPENKIVSSKIEMIKDILKYQSVDIYASTNLNKDPWLED